MVELGWNNSRTRVGVAELSAGRVAWARNAEAMSRLGNDSDFYFNLESLVLPDSQVHPFYTSSRPIFGPSRFEFNGVSSSARGSVARTIEASRDNRRLNTDSDSLVS